MFDTRCFQCQAHFGKIGTHIPWTVASIEYASLGFPVLPGSFYLVNPNDEDEAPFWIAQVAAIGHIFVSARYVILAISKITC